MSNERQPTPGSEQDAPTPPQSAAPGHIDRRKFFRGAAALTVGGFGAPAVLAQDAAPRGGPAAAPARADAAEQLAAQTGRSLRWAGREPADWVRARAGADHNVVIVGGGQSGVAIAYGLKRKGVGRVDVLDQADPGQAGIWRNIARMHQLRTPKTLLPGPEAGNVALSFRALVRNVERPRGVRRIGSNSAPRLGGLLGLVPAGHGHEGALSHAAHRDRAAGRRAAPAFGDGRCAARGDNAQARARERLRRRGRTERAGFRARAAAGRVDAYDRPHPGRDVQGQGRRGHRRGLLRVRCGGGRARERRGRGASVQPPLVHRLSIAGVTRGGRTTRAAPLRPRRRPRPSTVGIRTCSSSPISFPTPCAGETFCSAIAAWRPCRSTRSSGPSRSRASTYT